MLFSAFALPSMLFADSRDNRLMQKGAEATRQQLYHLLNMLADLHVPATLLGEAIAAAARVQPVIIQLLQLSS